MRLPLELIELILEDVEYDCNAALVLVSHMFRIYTNRARFNHIEFWSQEPIQMTAAIHAFCALLSADTSIWAARPLACLAHNVRSFKYSFAHYESPRAQVRDTTRDGSVVAILGSIFRGLSNILLKPGSAYHLNLGIKTARDEYVFDWTLLPLDFRAAVDDLCHNSHLNYLTLYATSRVHPTLIYSPQLVYLQLDLVSIWALYPLTIAASFPALNTLIVDAYSRNSLLAAFISLKSVPDQPLPLDLPSKMFPTLETLVFNVMGWTTAVDVYTLGHHTNNLRNIELKFKALDYDHDPDIFPRGMSYVTFPHLHTLTLHICLPTFMGSSRIINALPLMDSTLSSISCLNLAFENTYAYPVEVADSMHSVLLDALSPAIVDAHLLALHNISALDHKVEITVKALPYLNILKDETFDANAFEKVAILQIRSAFPLLNATQDVVFRPMVHTKLQMA